MIGENSRFKGTFVLLDEQRDVEIGGRVYISPFREKIFKAELGDIQIVYELGMRFDLLANEYYGDPILEWIIMDANPKYMTHFDIKIGDIINIPHPNRVMIDE